MSDFKDPLQFIVLLWVDNNHPEFADTRGWSDQNEFLDEFARLVDAGLIEAQWVNGRLSYCVTPSGYDAIKNHYVRGARRTDNV